MSSTSMDALRQKLGVRYEIDRPLGRGGMGAVYLARDRQLDRLLAIKVLPAEFASQGDLRERFLRETRTAASFSHPNIVPVFAIEEHDDLLAMAMGYVEGESLRERVERAGPLSIHDTVRLLDDVAYALAYAHGRGVVHRDIKPDNIMIERASGRALVMDFGVARSIAAPVAGGGALTRVGEVVGTPEYMSPEQATGDVVDARSDLYSLGLVAWFALTGQNAMNGQSIQTLIVQQLTETLPPIVQERADVPLSLSNAIERCLIKSPSERFDSAEALIEAVDVAREGASDVPLPIRQLAHEAGGLGYVFLICAGAMLLIWIVVTDVMRWSPLDAFAQMLVVAGVLAMRVVHVWQSVKRLMTLGFDASSVQRGFGVLMQERAAARAMLRTDERYVRRQRMLRVAAVFALMSTFVLARIANGLRTQIDTNSFDVPLLAQVLFFLRAIILGASVVVLVRSPLRMSVDERIFRWTWLSFFGRWVLARAARAVGAHEMTPHISVTGTPSTSTATRTKSSYSSVANAPISNPSVAKAQATTESASVATLAARVERLEAWRERVEKSPPGKA